MQIHKIKIVYLIILSTVLLYFLFNFKSNTIIENSNTRIIKEYSNKNKIVVDVVVPFIEEKLENLLVQLNSWNDNDSLPCDIDGTITSYNNYTIESNLIFYLNFVKNQNVEDQVYSNVESSIWRNCFNKVQFIYANNSYEEDKYPMGIGTMFYKYFKIGNKSDFFFWMESDVNVIKQNWQFELCRLCIDFTTIRGNKPFFVMGSTFVGEIGKSKQKTIETPLHINGNALYWNSNYFYDNFISHVENWVKKTNYFDYDMTKYLNDYDNWGEVKNIRQEFIVYDFIQNYNYDSYDKDYILLNHPRTFFIHYSDHTAKNRKRK